jgi:hypothetical protein
MAYEIYNYKTGYEMGREFPTKQDAQRFIKYLKEGTSTKLFWRARKKATKQNPSTIKVRANSSGLIKVQMKKVGVNWNVYLGGTRVGTFGTRDEATKYGKHLIKQRGVFKKR